MLCSRKRRLEEDERQSIPNVLQGEVARLDPKFLVNLDPSHCSNNGTVHLICKLGKWPGLGWGSLPSMLEACSLLLCLTCYSLGYPSPNSPGPPVSHPMHLSFSSKVAVVLRQPLAQSYLHKVFPAFGSLRM